MDDRTAPEGLTALEPIRSPSVAVEAARALRREILRRGEGDMFLGSEDELIRQLGISRPSFRQAARLLEYEELLVIRRGAGGGYFGRRPSADVVVRMAGIYLLAQGATFAEVICAQRPMQVAALQAIAGNPNPAVRSRPAEYLESCRALVRPYDIPSAVRAINGFWQLLPELLANRAMMLFMRASQAYGAKASTLALTAARLDFYVGGLHDMAEALKAGDAERAVAIAQSRTDQLIEWSQEEGE